MPMFVVGLLHNSDCSCFQQYNIEAIPAPLSSLIPKRCDMTDILKKCSFRYGYSRGTAQNL